MEDIVKLITKFLSRYKADEIEGVLLYGSAVSGRLNKKSDIDIIVAVNTDSYTEKVGCSKIDGVKIEYFVHNIDNLYELALKQIELNDPSRLTKYITSKIIYDKSGKFKTEIDKIKKLYDLPIRKKHDNYIKKSIFHIKNRIDDLYSLIEADSFYIVYFDILNKIRELDTLINGYIIIPLSKSEKLFKDSNYMSKYIDSDVHKTSDEIFIKKYLECLKIKDRSKMIKDLEDLYEYVFRNEKFNSDGFELVFEKGSIGV